MGKHKKGLAVCIIAVLLLLAASLLTGFHGRAESVQEAMRDAVLHNVNQITFIGGGLYPGVRHSTVPAYPGKIPDGAGRSGGPV